MPAYNCEKYVCESIESVLCQSLGDFEFIIIDDASTDNTKRLINEYVEIDQRIIFLENTVNLGISASLNRGFAIANGEFLVRMDADDICYQNRFFNQYEFMRANPGIGISGTGAVYSNSNVLLKNEFVPFTKNDQLKFLLIFECPFVHSTVIIRKELILENNLLYRLDYGAEDYKFWSESSRFCGFGNLNIPLIYYRVNYTSYSHTNKTKQTISAELIRLENLTALGVQFSEDEFIIHNMICDHNAWFSMGELERAHKWLEKLLLWSENNSDNNIQNIKEVLDFYWYKTIIKYKGSFICVLKVYNKSVFSNFKLYSIKKILLSSTKNRIKQLIHFFIN